ncbi:MAG: hypothetical protein LW832_10575 [Parachlamydia sp.]|nr:hypothetical protein [Parachlamydia sp.]
MNSHLDLKNFNENELKELALVFPNVKEINLCDSSQTLEGAWLKALNKFNHLESLNLVEVDLTENEHLDAFKEMVKLKSLEVDELPYQAFLSISKLPQLEYLYAMETGEMSDPIALSNVFPHLKILLIDNYSQNFLENLKLEHVEIFVIESAEESIENYEFLHDMKKLNQLELDQGSDKILSQLKELKTLEILKFNECSNVTDRGINQLKNLENLQVLRLPDNAITDQGFNALCNLSQLVTLDASSHLLTDKSLRGLHDLKNLKSLSLSHANLTKKGLLEVGKLTALRTLNLTNLRYLENESLDDALQLLTNLSELKKINLGFTTVSEQGIHLLKNFKMLRTLDLSGCQFTGQNLDLTGFEQLKDINLTGCTNLQEGEWLSQLAVKSLTLNYTSINKEWFEKLRSNSSIENLFLDGCRLTEKEIISFVNSHPLNILSIRRSTINSEMLEELPIENLIT